MNIELPLQGSSLQLRPYQEEAIERTLEAQERDVLRQLGIAATGLGKTCVFTSLAQRLGCKTLILAHRDELITQAMEKVRAWAPGTSVGIFKAGQAELDAQIVVGSVQTASREKRIVQLAEQSFDLVIVDEAHHARADTYIRILGQINHDKQLLLGVTATPDRGDKKGLDHIFDEIVWNYDILWGIRSGYLSDIKGKSVALDSFDLSEIKIKKGDYDQGQAGRKLEEAGAPDFLSKSYVEYAQGRRTIVFTPTVEMSKRTEQAFLARGVKVAEVNGATPLEERRHILRNFENGTLDVVVNCQILVEGFDNPAVSCIMVARPTRSRACYTQMIGRGTRRHPEKDYLLVLDLVGATEEHSLVTIPSLFGVQNAKEWQSAGRSITEQLAHQEELAVKAGRLRAQDVEMFKTVQQQNVPWVVAEGELKRYMRSLPKQSKDEAYSTIWIQQLDGDHWSSGLLEEETGENKPFMTNVSLELAQGVAEDYLRKYGTLFKVDAPWRSKPPTEKQKDAARKWRMSNYESYDTAGGLSDALDRHIQAAKERQRKKGVQTSLKPAGAPTER